MWCNCLQTTFKRLVSEVTVVDGGIDGGMNAGSWRLVVVLRVVVTDGELV